MKGDIPPTTTFGCTPPMNDAFFLMIKMLCGALSALSYPFGSFEQIPGCEETVLYSLLIGIAPNSSLAVILIEAEEKRL
jgi:hypothetical protein